MLYIAWCSANIETFFYEDDSISCTSFTNNCIANSPSCISPNNNIIAYSMSNINNNLLKAYGSNCI